MSLKSKIGTSQIGNLKVTLVDYEEKTQLHLNSGLLCEVPESDINLVLNKINKIIEKYQL